jgi:hypothetical protein
MGTTSPLHVDDLWCIHDDEDKLILLVRVKTTKEKMFWNLV